MPTSAPEPGLPHEPQPPLKPLEFLVLAVLADERLHGYGLVKAIEERSEGRVRVRPGNLYRVLDRLIAEGLVSEEPADGQPSGGGERTRLFSLTTAGREAATAEARLLTDVIRSSRALRRAVEKGRG
jgi:DNA-binding PadR family transcriptional regulator